MPTSTATSSDTLLKYANLQMAAEATDLSKVLAGTMELKDALVNGNNRASKFTQTQASQFVSDGWVVVDHKPDTTTGFSGTLFRNTKTGELVMSFRSTEFADDAARDNQATNALEIREKGFAFGQIDDMQSWYASLQASGKITGPLTVTGYSLGGHLATAFNMLHKGEGVIAATYTFNGAGVGQYSTGTLKQVVDQFHALRDATTSDGSGLTDSAALSLDAEFRGRIKSGSMPTASDFERVNLLVSNAVDRQMLLDALNRIKTIGEEVVRIQGISNAVMPTLVDVTQIAAMGYSYQMAVLVTSKSTSAYRTGLADSSFDLVNGVRAQAGGLNNVYDVYGAVPPSAVSNSQIHYGSATPVAIEDQPNVRGAVIWQAATQSALYLDTKLLVNDFNSNDFGDTHSLVLLVDSLGVQTALAQLDGSVSSSTIDKIFKAGTNAAAYSTQFLQGMSEGDLLENLVSGLGRMLGLDTASDTKDKWKKLKGDPAGGTWARTADKDGYTGRDSLQIDLDLIVKSPAFKALIGKSTITLADSSIASKAKTDFGAFLSLNTLSPIVISTTDAAAIAALKAANPTMAADWTSDLNARQYGDTGKVYSYSDSWYNDRTALLQAVVTRNTQNVSSESIPDPLARAGVVTDFEYVDVNNPASTTLLSTQRPGTGAAPHQYIAFGDEGSNTLTGSDINVLGDRLYGMAGADTLYGLSGNDYLEGGSGDDVLDGGVGADLLLGGDGNDTYLFTGSWGNDVITDSDGLGQIVVDGVTLSGGKQTGTSTWLSTNGQISYLLT